jgi:serine O-acetyltransferase
MLAELRADIRRFHRLPSPPTTLGMLRLIVDHFGLQALVVYRVSRSIHQRAHATRYSPWRAALPLARFVSRAAGRIYGIYLDPGADIGPGLYIGHSGGIHVTDCRLGARCSIHQRVRIARAPDDAAGPSVGDRVWIGCHASVTGPLRIGSGATLGAGAVVTRDVPERALVVGSPARVIQRDYDNAAIL